MALTEKDKNILVHITKHCETIFSSMQRFGDVARFSIDADYFNSVCMSLLQIGELANHLTSDFQETHRDIPWRNIIGLRNIVVHGYGQLDKAAVWATLQDDIPPLHRNCLSLVSGPTE
jgi:uncharacterized protein with HEPN domain